MTKFTIIEFILYTSISKIILSLNILYKIDFSFLSFTTEIINTKYFL